MKQKPNRYLPKVISGSGGKSASQSARYIGDEIQSTGTVRALAVLSAGPIEGLAAGQQSLKLDATPYANADNTRNFEGISWQITSGASDQAPIDSRGFNHVERAVTVNLQLLPSNAIIRTGSGNNARVTIRFPQGLIQQTSAGYFHAGIKLRIERRLGQGAWEKALERDINKKQLSLFEMQFLIHAPQGTIAGAKWSIRLTRLTPARDEPQLRDRIDWGWVTWISQDRLSYAGVSLLAITASAKGVSGQLPRIAVDVKGRLVRLPINYNPATRDYSGIWNGRFKTAWTDNPAWVLYDLLTDRHWGLGLADSSIDRYDFYALARYADGLVSDGAGAREVRYRFDALIRNRQSARQLIGRICARVRAVVFWSGGQLRCVFDAPSAVVMRLTNAHVAEGRFVYSTAPRQSWFSHAVVSFDDPSSHQGVGVEVETSSVLLTRHGFRPHEVRLLGCQRRSEARRHARWLLETAEAGLHSISWRAGLDHFADHPVRPGDVVSVYDAAHLPSAQIPLRLRLAGRKLLVREAIAARFDAGASLKLRYETASGWHSVAVSVRDIADDGFTRAEITRTNGAAWAPAPLEDGIGVIYGAAATASEGALYRVVSLREVGRFQVEVDAIRHDATKYARIDAASAAITAPATPSVDFTAPLPKVTGLTSRQLATGAGRDMYISWTPPSDARIARWQIEATDPHQTTRQIKSSEENIILHDCAAGVWQVAVRAVDWLGRQGAAATLAMNVKPDAATPAKPTNLRLIAGYGQLALRWTQAQAEAEVEIWEYPTAANANGVLVDVVRGTTTWISLDRTAGVRPWFRLRSRLAGGTLSAFTKAVSGAALAFPEPQDGQDGTDGTDGQDGTRGGIMASNEITNRRWSNTAALAALRLLVAGGAVAGDLVTLYVSGSNAWSQTRRYDGTNWIRVTKSLAGDQLTDQSVPADRLKLDGTALIEDTATGALTIGSLNANRITSGQLTSSNYVAGESGFHIDMAGGAEFNEATIRGALIGTRIESATLVSSISTTPTEAGKPFLTLDSPRPLTYQLRNKSGNYLTFGPLMIVSDQAAIRFGDARAVAVAANDPHGAVATSPINPHFSRFWALTPAFRISMNMVRGGTPWGAVINHGRVRVRVETSGGTRLAESRIFDLSLNHRWSRGQNDATYTNILSQGDGFAAGSSISLSRSVVYNTARTSYFTGELAMDLEIRCPFSRPAPTTTGEGIQFKILLDFDTTAHRFNVVDSFYYSLNIEGNTIDG